MFSWKLLGKRLVFISIVALLVLVVGNATYYLCSRGGSKPPCNDCYTNALWIFSTSSSPDATFKAAILGFMIFSGICSVLFVVGLLLRQLGTED